jgi:secreted PhoX family phosphatase
VNCAGGTTPWGTYLTCEETTVGPTRGWGRPHGYVFEVSSSANSAALAVPMTRLGRFSHEAALADFGTGIVYETEDNGENSGFYRFVPDRPGDLRAGRLQMLAVEGQPN